MEEVRLGTALWLVAGASALTFAGGLALARRRQASRRSPDEARAETPGVAAPTQPEPAPAPARAGEPQVLFCPQPLLPDIPLAATPILLKEASPRLRRLVEGLQGQPARQAPCREPLELRPLLEIWLGHLQPCAQGRRLVLAEGPDGQVMAERAGLMRVLEEMVAASAQGAPEGGEIRLRLLPLGFLLVLQVEDDGSPITPAELARVFPEVHSPSGCPLGLRLPGVGRLEFPSADEGGPVRLALPRFAPQFEPLLGWL
ncbi:MAG TPA: hypothetical protein VNO81_07045 [Candidatus Nitrosotenuis sp.]|nr:hypothetical protein [Candidatus Nitrosotenuis sp.]